jgi:hypothetical protein
VSGAASARCDDRQRRGGQPHEELAAGGERGNQQVAQLRRRPDRLSESGRRHEQDPPGLADDAVGERLLPGQHRQLAVDLARPAVLDDVGGTVGVVQIRVRPSITTTSG